MNELPQHLITRRRILQAQRQSVIATSIIKALLWMGAAWVVISLLFPK